MMTPNLSTIVSFASSKQAWNGILSFHHRCCKSANGLETDKFYQQCFLKWGADWKYYDLVNVNYAISKLVAPKKVISLGHGTERSLLLSSQVNTSAEFYVAPLTFQALSKQNDRLGEDFYSGSSPNWIERQDTASLVTGSQESHIVIGNLGSADQLEGMLTAFKESASGKNILTLGGLSQPDVYELWTKHISSHRFDFSFFEFIEEGPGVGIAVARERK